MELQNITALLERLFYCFTHYHLIEAEAFSPFPPFHTQSASIQVASWLVHHEVSPSCRWFPVETITNADPSQCQFYFLLPASHLRTHISVGSNGVNDSREDDAEAED